ncbi:FixH family protein [Oscillatoria amoena NRMC-F 0135]|nr:FixH family protein [Oscillatoria amoena NRMC-F 0135]
MNWGKWIVVSFVVFAVFIGVIVIISMKQDVNLVSEGYYQDELVYQKKLDRKNNTEQLREKPDMTIVDRTYLRIYFPEAKLIEQGEVQLFRPSSDKLDQRFKLSSSADSVQLIPLQNLQPGAYRVKMLWTMEGADYYLEKFIVI